MLAVRMTRGVAMGVAVVTLERALDVRADRHRAAPNDLLLLNLVQNPLTNIRASGELEQVIRKWFGPEHFSRRALAT
jgi:ABC-type amino acid transport substrate-binding protein